MNIFYVRKIQAFFVGLYLQFQRITSSELIRLLLKKVENKQFVSVYKQISITRKITRHPTSQQADLIEIKAFSKPPPSVKLLLDTVYLAFNETKPSSDVNSRKEFSDINVFLAKARSITLDDGNKNKAIWIAVTKEIETHGLNVQIMLAKSKAAAGLLAWLQACTQAFCTN